MVLPWTPFYLPGKWYIDYLHENRVSINMPSSIGVWSPDSQVQTVRDSLFLAGQGVILQVKPTQNHFHAGKALWVHDTRSAATQVYLDLSLGWLWSSAQQDSLVSMARGTDMHGGKLLSSCLYPHIWKVMSLSTPLNPHLLIAGRIAYMWFIHQKMIFIYSFPPSVAVKLPLNLDSDTSLHACYLHWRENNWVVQLAGLLWCCCLAPTHALFEGSSLYFIRSQPPLCTQSTQWQSPCSHSYTCVQILPASQEFSLYLCWELEILQVSLKVWWSASVNYHTLIPVTLMAGDEKAIYEQQCNLQT